MLEMEIKLQADSSLKLALLMMFMPGNCLTKL